MRHIRSFVDERMVARDFHTGDPVRKAGARGLCLSPYVGRVVYSNTELGTVQVQWPWGSEQETPSELVRLSKESEFLAPEFDDSPNTWERSRHEDGKAVSKLNKAWLKKISSAVRSDDTNPVLASFENSNLPIKIAAFKAWHRESSEIEASMSIASHFSDSHTIDVVNQVVASVFADGHRLSIYWKDKKRQYKTTRREETSKVYSCPRCKGSLKPRTYRHADRILLCRSCGFSIHPGDLLRKPST